MDFDRKDCIPTINIHQEILESGNLLHNQGFVDFQTSATVCIINDSYHLPKKGLEGKIQAGQICCLIKSLGSLSFENLFGSQ